MMEGMANASRRASTTPPPDEHRPRRPRRSDRDRRRDPAHPRADDRARAGRDGRPAPPAQLHDLLRAGAFGPMPRELIGQERVVRYVCRWRRRRNSPRPRASPSLRRHVADGAAAGPGADHGHADLDAASRVLWVCSARRAICCATPPPSPTCAPSDRSARTPARRWRKCGTRGGLKGRGDGLPALQQGSASRPNRPMRERPLRVASPASGFRRMCGALRQGRGLSRHLLGPSAKR